MIDQEGVSHFNLMLKDFLWGTFAGVFLTVSGHPFDFIKVRMQTASPPVGLSECMTSILRSEGPFSFYRGLTPPLTTIPLVNAIVMSSYELWKRLLGVESEEEFTFAQSLLSGVFAGFVNSFIISPVELVKWRLQMQTEAANGAYYKGSMDCTMKVIQDEGLKTLLTSGLLATILRETFWYGGQFGGYYLAKRSFAKLENWSVDDLSHTSLFLSGGIGGLFCWLFSYPQDIIKTRLQTQRVGIISIPEHEWIPDEGVISWATDIWKSEGWHGFWRGFSAWSIRAFWANAFMFSTYEFAMKRIDYFIE